MLAIAEALETTLNDLLTKFLLSIILALNSISALELGAILEYSVSDFFGPANSNWTIIGP